MSAVEDRGSARPDPASPVDPSRLLAEFPEMNPGPVLRLDADGMIEHLNTAARAVLAIDDPVGQCWRDVCPGMPGDVWEEIRTADWNVAFESDTEDGCILYTHVRRPSGENIFVFGADVTDLRMAERAVEQQAAELAELARFPDMNPGPVLRVRTDGTVVLANKAARRVFVHEVLQGRKWTDICAPVGGATWERIRGSAKDVSIEVKVDARYMVFTHTPPTEAGNIFVYGADITEQKTTERVLAQTEKMATLGTLSAGIAHEINNPAAAAVRATGHLRKAVADMQSASLRLSSQALSPESRETIENLDRWAREHACTIVALDAMARHDREESVEAWLGEHAVEDAWDLAAELVENGIAVDHLPVLLRGVNSGELGHMLRLLSASSAVYRLLEEVYQGASRVSEIVGALREYSYLDQAPIQDVDVNRGIRNTLVILQSRIKKGVEIVEELSDDLPRITAFGSQLNQVWTNLLDNALAVLDAGGRISVRSRGEADGVVVEIEDDGPGISPENQSRVFDAFFTTKPMGEGTGLGLHTCYSIVVNRHGGRLDLSSRPGCTRFSVWLPPKPRRTSADD